MTTVRMDDFNIKPKKKILIKLGLVAARASQVEHLLRLLIKDLSEKNFNGGLEITDEKSNLEALKRKIEKIIKKPSKQENTDESDLKPILSDEVESHLKPILTDIEKLAKIRNNIIHTRWSRLSNSIADKDFDDFHTCCAQLMTQIEAFRQPRYHDKDSYTTYESW